MVSEVPDFFSDSPPVEIRGPSPAIPALLPTSRELAPNFLNDFSSSVAHKHKEKKRKKEKKKHKHKHKKSKHESKDVSKYIQSKEL
jgi:hypothetical protein